MLSRYWNLLSLLACVGAVTASDSSDASIAQRDFSSRQTTSLGAITIRSEEQKRGLPNFKPNFECSHHYADHDSILRGAHSRFATTSMKYRLPAVTLEDIELHVKNIMCSESTIIINFPSSNLLAEAEMEWKDLSEFLVISSHAGCNGEGARAPYLVSNVDYVSKSNSAVLSVKRLEWSDTYDTMEIKFGMGLYESSSLRVHHDLRKRITTIVSVKSSETVSFPPPPSATPTASTSVYDIGHSVPADFILGTFSVATAGANETLSIKCAKCSIEGSIELTQGVFTISSSSLETQKAVNFLEHGYFDTVVNGLGAHIEIDAAIAGTFTESFNTSLVTLPLPGFQIPEIAAIGPMWIPTIRGAISVSTTLDFTYGFEVAVPDDSSIRFNIGNLSDSTSHGFNNTSVTALPLTATDSSIALTLSLALHSEILLGVSILSGRGSIAAGAFLDLPALSVSITQLSSVDKNCNPAQNASLSPSQNLDSIDIFSSLTNIVPKAEIALGLEASAQLAVSEIEFVESVGTTATLAGTAILLPTACLSFDSKMKAFVSPTATGTAGSSSGDSKKSANAGVQLSAPLALAGDMGSLYWTVGMMMGVVIVALGL
ncbi:hypothetical protein OCU04_008187 [Sclerotinia nivalis]|uniref:GPI anchored protein n=1 Tax=Sclerotinia nivalis TaxID=352851 RepID=A0A9X0DHT5_9HELO|nr:hypothetical protein OCU04_008187 [Sclerotinia nivalis]